MFHAQQAQALSRQKSDIMFQAQQAKAHLQQAKQRCAIIFQVHEAQVQQRHDIVSQAQQAQKAQQRQDHISSATSSGLGATIKT